MYGGLRRQMGRLLCIITTSIALGFILTIVYPPSLDIKEDVSLFKFNQLEVRLVRNPQDEIDEEEEWMAEMEEEMAERILRVKEVCGRNDVHFKKGIKRNFFLVDHKHKLGFCRTPKVSTTTLLTYFLELSDLSEEEKAEIKGRLLKLHTKLAPRFLLNNTTLKSMEVMNKHLRDNAIFLFSFVRHPWERIVSAFEDKLVKNRPSGYYRQLSIKTGANFTVFIDYLLEGYKKIENKGCNIAEGRCPTDQHFSPYYSWCGYCDIPYQAIGKSETFADDWRYIVIKTGLQDVFPELNIQMHAVPHSDDRTMKYFNQLSQRQKEELFQIYRLDFELFGYEATEYL